jgi:hypothetical protein
MPSLFVQLTLADVHQDVARNIVSLRQSQDLFDDLTDDPAEWLLAQTVEDEVKSPPYRSRVPIIDRPFEDAQWFNAIMWHGSDSVETTVYESAHHLYRGLLSDAGFERLTVIAERKVYSVACNAALLDFRRADAHPNLLHPSDYAFCQSVGARIHREGHPGLLVKTQRSSIPPCCPIPGRTAS